MSPLRSPAQPCTVPQHLHALHSHPHPAQSPTAGVLTYTAAATLLLSLSLSIHSARQVLMDGWHGDRPVTLIGYSVGARVVFRCLLELAAAGHSGCVEHAVLIAAPVSPHATHWAAARCVVVGRLANVWSERDCLLGVLHRLQVTPQPLASTQRVVGTRLSMAQAEPVPGPKPSERLQ